MVSRLKLDVPIPPKESVISYTILRLDENIGSGRLAIYLQANNGDLLHHAYSGAEGVAFMEELNTSDCSVTSRQDRVLQRLSDDGVIVGVVEDVVL